MKAIWSKHAGLTIHGQHNGQPRIGTIKAWASIASGEPKRSPVAALMFWLVYFGLIGVIALEIFW